MRRVVTSRWTRWLGCSSAALIALGILVWPSHGHPQNEGAPIVTAPPAESAQVRQIGDTASDGPALVRIGSADAEVEPSNAGASSNSPGALLPTSNSQISPPGAVTSLRSGSIAPVTRSPAPRIVVQQAALDETELDANAILQFAEGNSSVVLQDRLMSAAGVSMNVHLDHNQWPYGVFLGPGPGAMRGPSPRALPHPRGTRVQVSLKWVP